MSTGFAYPDLMAKGLPAPAARWGGNAKFNFVGGHNDRKPGPGHVDDPGRRVAVGRLGRADLRDRSIGDLDHRGRPGREEIPMRRLDVIDLPEDQREVDPRLGRQADLDALSGEQCEVVALERRILPDEKVPEWEARQAAKIESRVATLL